MPGGEITDLSQGCSTVSSRSQMIAFADAHIAIRQGEDRIGHVVDRYEIYPALRITRKHLHQSLPVEPQRPVESVEVGGTACFRVAYHDAGAHDGYRQLAEVSTDELLRLHLAALVSVAVLLPRVELILEDQSVPAARYVCGADVVEFLEFPARTCQFQHGKGAADIDRAGNIDIEIEPGSGGTVDDTGRSCGEIIVSPVIQPEFLYSDIPLMDPDPLHEGVDIGLRVQFPQCGSYPVFGILLAAASD